MRGIAVIGMFDTAFNDQFPAGAAAYAGYVDGQLGDQPNYAHVVSTYPSAQHLSVALFADHDADCLDVEDGASAPGDIPGWHARQKARGIGRPVVYASASTMEDEVLQVLSGACIGLASVRLWTAHYAGEHICGPGSCGQLSVPADGTQWTSSAMGRTLDQSLLLDSFFAPPAPASPPADQVFAPVRGLTAVPGHTSVLLSWSAPPPAPWPLGHYQVTVRHDGEDIPGYPRDVPKAANPQTWQGGSLPSGAACTAMVRARGAGGGHSSDWASVEFRTSEE
jgi:hypothetical protein